MLVNVIAIVSRTETMQMLSLVEVEVVVNNDVGPDGTIVRSSSPYLLMATPRITQSSAQVAMKFNDRQQIAFERHEWKRCVGVRSMRWVGSRTRALSLIGLLASDCILLYCCR